MTVRGDVMEEEDKNVFEVLLANCEDAIAELCQWERTNPELLDLDRAIRRYAYDQQGLKNLPALTPTVSEDGELSYVWKRNPSDPPLLHWDNWLAIPQVELWEACALSFAVNPDTIALKPRTTSHGRGPSYSMQLLPSRVSHAEFNERYLMLHKCISGSDPHFTKFTRQGLAGRYIATVSLAEFAEWAVNALPGDLPSELIAFADEQSSMKSTENSTTTTSENINGDANPEVTTDQSMIAADESESATELGSKMPSPLSTSDIAFCFEGLLCRTEHQWKVLLGKCRKWTEACRVEHGTRGRGGAPKLWNPVLLGAALVKKGTPQKKIRAKFRSQPPLKQWLEEWNSYEADFLSDD